MKKSTAFRVSTLLASLIWANGVLANPALAPTTAAPSQNPAQSPTQNLAISDPSVQSVAQALEETVDLAARPESSNAVPMTDPYDIELLIFEQAPAEDTERWPEAVEPPNLLTADLPFMLTQEGPLQVIPDGVRALEQAKLTLNRKGLNVLLHEQWRQDIQDRDTPAWMAIHLGRLQGLLRVSKGRYLHLETDLRLQTPDLENNYPVQLHRRMRSDELHYLDHPKLGILMIAQRYEIPVEETVDTAPEPVDANSTEMPTEQEQQPKSVLPRAMPDPT